MSDKQTNIKIKISDYLGKSINDAQVKASIAPLDSQSKVAKETAA